MSDDTTSNAVEDDRETYISDRTAQFSFFHELDDIRRSREVVNSTGETTIINNYNSVVLLSPEQVIDMNLRVNASSKFAKKSG